MNYISRKYKKRSIIGAHKWIGTTKNTINTFLYLYYLNRYRYTLPKYLFMYLFIILSKIFLYQEFLLLFQPTLICSQPSWIRAASIGYNYRLLLFWLIHYLCYYIKYYLFKIFFYNLKNVNSKDNLRTFITLLFILFI